MQPKFLKHSAYSASQKLAEKQDGAHTPELRSTPEIAEALATRIVIIDKAAADCPLPEPSQPPEQPQTESTYVLAA
jgi:hypothetical protein